MTNIIITKFHISYPNEYGAIKKNVKNKVKNISDNDDNNSNM